MAIPLSATIITGYEVELKRQDATISHKSTGRMTCDASHFTIEMELAVGENGTTVFERRWHERIRRDMV